MSNYTIMDRLKSFLGLRQEPPRNDFRNPIWGTDDYDDGDELYTRHQIDTLTDPTEFNRQFTKQFHDMFSTIGSLFDGVKLFFNEIDQYDVGQFDSLAGFADVPDSANDYNVRDYYLKPGYQNRKLNQPQDMDLDGKITSNEMSGLLNQNDKQTSTPFDSKLVPGRSFCQTIITTTVTKPDGTIETRRVFKNGNEVFEETTTSSPDSRGPFNTSFDSISSTGILYSHVLSELSTLFRNFY